MRSRPFGLSRDAKRRVHARVSRKRGAVKDVQAGHAKRPQITIDHTARCIGANHCPTQEVCSHRNTEWFGNHGTCRAVVVFCQIASHLVPGFNPSRVLFAIALLRRNLATKDATLGKGS